MQRVGDAGDLAGRPRSREADAPTEVAEDETKTRLQRMAVVAQHPRNLAQQTRHGLRSDQRGRDAPGITERTGFSREVAVDEHDVEAEGLQPMRARRADDAGTDDDCACAARRAAHGAFRRPLLPVSPLVEGDVSVRCTAHEPVRRALPRTGTAESGAPARCDAREMFRRGQPRAAARASRCCTQRG